MNQLGHDGRIDWEPLFEPVSFCDEHDDDLKIEAFKMTQDELH